MLTDSNYGEQNHLIVSNLDDRSALAESDNGDKSSEDWLQTPATPQPSSPMASIIHEPSNMPSEIEVAHPLTPKPVINKVKRNYKPLVIPTYVTISDESPPNYTCTICNKIFKARVHIRYHLYCDGTKKPFKCTTCNKEFISKSHYNYHVRSHDGSRPFACNMCKKAFSLQGKLKRHLQTHSGDRPFVCSLCGQAYKNSDALKRHQVTHADLKPHKCSLCSKRFSSLANHRIHSRIHKGETNYMCDVCGKSFRVKGTLMQHIQAHSRARPYNCNICSRVFGCKKNLTRHRVVHSRGRPFGCPLCNLAFRRKDNFGRHMKNNHPQSSGLPPIMAPMQKEPEDVDPLDIGSASPNPLKLPSLEISLSEPTRSNNSALNLTDNMSDSVGETVYSNPSKSGSLMSYGHSINGVQFKHKHESAKVYKFTSPTLMENVDQCSVTHPQRPQIIQQLNMSELFKVRNITRVSPSNKSTTKSSSSVSESSIDSITSVDVPLPPRTLPYQAVPVINRANVSSSPKASELSSIIKMGTASEMREPSNCVRTITCTPNLQKRELAQKETPLPAVKVTPACEALGPELLGEGYHNPEKPTLRLYLSDVHWRKRIMELLNLKKKPTTDSLVYDKSAGRSNDLHKEKLVLNKSDIQQGDSGSTSKTVNDNRKSNAKTQLHSQNSQSSRSQSSINSKLGHKVASRDNPLLVHGRIHPRKHGKHYVDPPHCNSNSSSHCSNVGLNEVDPLSDDGNQDYTVPECIAQGEPVIVENIFIKR